MQCAAGLARYAHQRCSLSHPPSSFPPLFHPPLPFACPFPPSPVLCSTTHNNIQLHQHRLLLLRGRLAQSGIELPEGLFDACQEGDEELMRFALCYNLLQVIRAIKEGGGRRPCHCAWCCNAGSNTQPTQLHHRKLAHFSLDHPPVLVSPLSRLFSARTLSPPTHSRTSLLPSTPRPAA